MGVLTGLCNNRLHPYEGVGGCSPCRKAAKQRNHLAHPERRREAKARRRRRQGIPERVAAHEGHEVVRNARGRCIACRRASARTFARSPKGKARRLEFYGRHRARIISERMAYAATPKGQIVKAKADLKYRMKEKIARIAELEGELQFYGSP